MGSSCLVIEILWSSVCAIHVRPVAVALLPHIFLTVTENDGWGLPSRDSLPHDLQRTRRARGGPVFDLQ